MSIVFTLTGGGMNTSEVLSGSLFIYPNENRNHDLRDPSPLSVPIAVIVVPAAKSKPYECVGLVSSPVCLLRLTN